MYTIHPDIQGDIHSLIYVLLPEKSDDIYFKMYALVKGMEAHGIKNDNRGKHRF